MSYSEYSYYHLDILLKNRVNSFYQRILKGQPDQIRSYLEDHFKKEDSCEEPLRLLGTIAKDHRGLSLLLEVGKEKIQKGTRHCIEEMIQDIKIPKRYNTIKYRGRRKV